MTRGRSHGDGAYIVAIGIRDEGERVEGDLVHELDALVVRCVVDAALEDAAAVAVSRNLNAVGRDGVVDEL